MSPMRMSPMRKQKRKSRCKGQGFAEASVGILTLIPVVMCMLDLAALVLGCTANDNLARNAARAAAGAVDPTTGLGNSSYARSAAYLTTSRFSESQICSAPSPGDGASLLTTFSYNGNPPDPYDANLSASAQQSNQGEVLVGTSMRVNVPAPLPFFTGYTFTAICVQPVVSLRAVVPAVPPPVVEPEPDPIPEAAPPVPPVVAEAPPSQKGHGGRDHTGKDKDKRDLDNDDDSDSDSDDDD